MDIDELEQQLNITDEKKEKKEERKEKWKAEWDLWTLDHATGKRDWWLIIALFNIFVLLPLLAIYQGVRG